MARHPGWRSQGDAGAGGDLTLSRLPSGVTWGEIFTSTYYRVSQLDCESLRPGLGFQMRAVVQAAQV